MPVTADSQLEGKVIWATLCYSKQRGSSRKKAEVLDAKKWAEPLLGQRLRQTSWKPSQTAAWPQPEHLVRPWEVLLLKAGSFATWHS